MADSIDRRAAIDVLCDSCETVDSSCAHYPCKRYLAIEDLPSVQPKRKTGEWIKMPYHVTECSECGFSLEDWIQGAFYNFCPNCGADMRGEQE